ncbi:MAG: metal-dependent hydrolase, partial [Leptospiraceae bacterium]|nr:metal-dependent hydrolase [Leptospiraceae bacterium]
FSTSFARVEFPIFIGLCLFGALWPDTDVGSTSRIIIYVLFFIIDVLLIFVFKYYLEAALFGLFTMLPAVSKHRGWTHSKFWTFIVGLPLLAPSFVAGEFLIDVHIYEYRNLIYFGVPYYFSFLFGVASHLILDEHPYFKAMRSKAGKKRS